MSAVSRSPWVPAVVAVYLVSLLSMAATATGSTLLAFRLEPMLAAVLSAAGVLGVAAAASWVVGKLGDVRFVIGAVATILAVATAQHVRRCWPVTSTSPTPTPTATGSAPTSARPAPRPTTPKIAAAIAEQTGKPATDVVLLTADFDFLSIYPYWGFRGLTSHYANPLAEFDKRAAAIEKWSKATTPAEMVANLDASPWRAPDVFLFRYSPDGYTFETGARRLRTTRTSVAPSPSGIGLRRSAIQGHRDRAVRPRRAQLTASPMPFRLPITD